MAQIRPFRAWRPPRELAARVACPPYDVLNTEEARELARGNEISYLHVNKPEIDFPPDHDPYADDVYERGRTNLQRMIEQGALQRDPHPSFYVYRQTMGAHTQTGLVAGASVDEYEADTIKKHEFTRPDKEDDRTRHIDVLDANDEPVFLTYFADPAIDALIAEAQSSDPVYDFVSDDGIGHTLWVAGEPRLVERLRLAFRPVGALYVADGHHRSAAATRVRRLRREANSAHTGQEEYNAFLAVIFPHNQMKIMAYNRVVKDLAGMSEEAFLGRLRERFEVMPADQAEPERRRTYGMFLGGRWHRLIPKLGTIPEDDPVGRLDAAILQNNLLKPLLGIEDPRRDRRIDFVGGIRGVAELQKRVQRGDAVVAFALFPTGIDELIQVADAGQVMPPKSTWFEPKLRSGLVIHLLD